MVLCTLGQMPAVTLSCLCHSKRQVTSQPLLSDLVVFFLVNFPGNLYQINVLRDTLNVIISLICMFAIYILLIAGFWLRLSIAINVFGVGSSQLFLLKNILISDKSHLF